MSYRYNARISERMGRSHTEPGSVVQQEEEVAQPVMLLYLPKRILYIQPVLKC